MTAPRLAVPPGRSGRLWLVRRLETARHGADLLDRKLRILEAELARREDTAARTAVRWEQCQAEARVWLLRAALLGGERAVRIADTGEDALVSVSYESTMGIRYPSQATCGSPAAGDFDGPVLAETRQAHCAALAAAAEHAAAAAAVQVLGAEVQTTRYRLRAVRDRWIPRLEGALAEVTFTLEELERSDAARLRRALPSR